MISILAFVLILAACSDNECIHISEKTEKAPSYAEDADNWKHSYREIITQMRDNLADQYNLRSTWNQFMYLAIHDFNDDSVPELIIGDNVSAAVFACEDREAVKIADLYEPEEWGGINGLYYCDNTLILRSDGSDGSGYVCFTFSEGEYVTGICDDYRIPEQSFDITLDDWGDVTFVACRPLFYVDFEDASFYLVNDDQILYKFPYRFENNSSKGYIGRFDNVGAVSFQDINNDKKDDVIIITYYVSGAGPTGMVPRPGVTIYLAGENEFCLAEDMIADAEENISQKDMKNLKMMLL